MPRKQTVEQNKADAIRQYCADHPDAMPVDVADAMGKKGMKVSAAYVSAIKHAHKIRLQRRGELPRSGLSVEALLVCREFVQWAGHRDKALEAIEFIERMGGTEDARSALATLNRLAK